MAPARQRLLILSAGMGAGHDAVAKELARRLIAAGHQAEIVDVLDLLPLGLGRCLRRWYEWMMRSAPWAYALIYRIFFVSGHGSRSEPAASPSATGSDESPASPGDQPSAPSDESSAPPGESSATPGEPSAAAPPIDCYSAWPLTVLTATRLRRLIRRRSPDAVVSTFHLAAQATGHLRRRRRLRVPSTVLVTDFAAHRLWLHPGNDRYLCPCPETALSVAAVTGRPAACHAPLISPVFGRPPAGVAAIRILRLGIRPVDRLVLVSAGSWGVGDVEETARILLGSGRYLPVVLCGHNDDLWCRLQKVDGLLALGWRDDMPALMATAHALVDNAAGLTCREAFAARLPVVSYLPIPGHGRDGVLAMARAGLSVHADDPAALIAALDLLRDPAERARRTARAAALFDEAPAEVLLTRPDGTSATEPDGIPITETDGGTSIRERGNPRSPDRA